jgi:hypothetical protein
MQRDFQHALGAGVPSALALLAKSGWSLPIIAALSLVACQESNCRPADESCNELANKPEWSVLQSYEARMRSARHDKPLLRFENALGSGLTVLAFPRQHAETGYVVMLENSTVAPKDKVMPAEDFVVSAQVLDAVRSNADLTPEAERKIAAMARE